jgi:hypothetical protein
MARKWTIVEQTEKAGKTEKTVPVKHVKMFPELDKGGNVIGFGRIKFICLKMLVQLKDETHTIMWSDYFKDGVGKFTWKQPKKTVPQYERDIESGKIVTDRKGRPIVDHMLPTKEVDGEKQVFENHTLFANYLTGLMGDRMAIEILNLFAEKMMAVTQRQAENAAKREKKAA